jgi:hypothetical protein
MHHVHTDQLDTRVLTASKPKHGDEGTFASPFLAPDTATSDTSPLPLTQSLLTSSIDSVTTTVTLTQVFDTITTTDEQSITPLSTPPPTGTRRDAVGVDSKAADSCGPHGTAARLSEDSHATRQLPPPVTCDTEAAADGEVEEENRGHRPASSFAAAAPPAGAQPLHPYLLALLPGLNHPLHTLKVIADGRCSVASVLLALGFIDDEHGNQQGRHYIDTARRALGNSLHSEWDEEQWITAVPIELRGANIRWSEDEKSIAQSSLDTYHRLLTKSRPETWLDHCVFYLASRRYDVGVIIVRITLNTAGDEEAQVSCRRVGQDCARHIVIVHTIRGRSGHYECVQYDGHRAFPPQHELVTRLIDLSATHPPQAAIEDDWEKHAWLSRSGHVQSPARQPASVKEVDQPSCSSAPATSAEGPLKPPPHTSPPDSSTSPPQPRRQALARRAKEPKQAPAPQAMSTRPPPTSSSTPTKNPRRQRRQEKSGKDASSLFPLPTAQTQLSAADIAAHGQLYDYISFTNVPQWVAICTLVLNAYRVASQAGDRRAQQQAIEDILMLPQRVLTRTSRGGDPRRLTSTIRARSKAVELRLRYRSLPACDHHIELTVNTKPLLHRARPVPAVSDPSTVDTDTDVHTESEGEESKECRPGLNTSSSTASSVMLQPATEEEEDCIDSQQEEEAHDDDYVRPLLSRTGADVEEASDMDQHGAKRAQHHVRQGHLRKAAQVLHSTATMADLRQPEVQAALRALHPGLPEGCEIPLLPAHSPLMILEDDDVMAQLLRRTDNGSASGPSGWGGNMISSLAESDVCRAGIIALLKDIINGNLPDRARQLLLACRAVAMAKPTGGYRPIAVGEMFYRLAGVIVVRKVTDAAATLLAPHQYGVGVLSGAEKILHSLQHTLTDKSAKLALLKVDISNAFNACDRARVLRELYATPQLSPMFRIADFAYAVPSELLLQRCEGQSISSDNGVRQGDPLSAVLFCLYMRPILAQVSAQVDVQLYGFFDDINVVGRPEEVMKALALLQRLLSEASLQCNTSKSHFAYFHQAEAPLLRSVRDTLAEHNIHFHGEWLDVVGAIVGKDEDAVRAGIHATLGSDAGRDAFFYRLQMGLLTTQSAMLLLRQCAVPQMNYVLRCLPPSCIAQQAEAFDAQVLRAAKTTLSLHADEGWDETDRILRAKLRHGGFGLTSAVHTSPAAYLGSLAAVAPAPAFAPYRKADCPLPPDTLLHGWISSSMKTIVAATPACSELLPSTASTFFQHFSKPSSSKTSKKSPSSSLQHSLSSQATKHSHLASLSHARQMKKQDGGAALAHALATSAPRAWAWKMVLPSRKEQELSDVQYRIAARLNLRLQPVAGASALPSDCPACNKKGAISRDPWHFLSCKKQHGGEQTRRHDEVVQALYRTALVLGVQVACEPAGLHTEDGKRPDLQLVLPGRHILTDVAVCHVLSAGALKSQHALRTTGVARHRETLKRQKYSETTKQQRAEMLPFVVETCGAMAPDAIRLLQIMGEAGQEHLAMWPKHEVIRHLVGSVAIAVQRGVAMTYLAGYEGAVAQLNGRRRKEIEREEQ